MIAKDKPQWRGRALLVQRIDERPKRLEPKLYSALSYFESVGGILGGKLDWIKFWEHLPALLNFQYMGNASFEHGQHAECIEEMSGYHLSDKYHDVIGLTIEVAFMPSDGGRHMETSKAEVKERWKQRFSQVPRNCQVHLICFENHEDRVIDLVRCFGSFDHKLNCDEEPHIWHSFMATGDERYKKLCAWWEIRQGWFAFKSRELFDETIRALGVKEVRELDYYD